MTFSSLIGERLKETRKALGLNQAEIAEIAGVSREYWGRMERGASAPGGEVLAAIAAAGVDTNYILTGEANQHVTGGRGSKAQELRDRALTAAPALRDERALTVGEKVPKSKAVLADEARLLAAFRAADHAGRAAILIAADGVAALAKGR
ncbi:helix-turn-helix transcriptional regulator [Ottowia sp.]|uniref:helix-turn-helix domain-containing protein n=1 Tax=Ottowia sp. TaxID=1898956 RepID=UPI0025E281AD|nr:helix-turn-helix transcriptional regulator [Ottowia sp.]